MAPFRLLVMVALLSASVAALANACAAERTGAELAVAAEAGEMDAQYLFARACLRGEGVPKDPAKALAWMKRAAAQGHAEALGGMGYFYAAGVAVEKNEEEAVRWFRQGAAKGSARAQLNLGQMLVSGKGVAKDEEEGWKWIERAAGQGLPDALYAQGEILFLGKYGQSRDETKAFPKLLEAAREGHAKAQNMVGIMLRDGAGVPIDLASAQSWLQKAAAQGNARARSNLGHLLGPDGADAFRRVEALKWLLLAARQHDVIGRDSSASLSGRRRCCAQNGRRV